MKLHLHLGIHSHTWLGSTACLQEHELLVLEMVPEMLKVVADGRFEPFLGRSFAADLGVADHEQVLHSHLEAADIDCNGMGLSVAVGMMGAGHLRLFYGHDQVPFGDFAVVAVAAVAVGTSEPVSVVVGHIEAAVAVLAAVVVAAVEVVIAVAVAGCIVVVADGTAVAEGSHMVVVGC